MEYRDDITDYNGPEAVVNTPRSKLVQWMIKKDFCAATQTASTSNDLANGHRWGPF